MEKKGHFVLIHGASHGAWCWYKVIPQLKSVGHKVTAMDMAGAGIHPKQVHEFKEKMDSDKAMDSQFLFHNGLDKPPTSACLGPNFMASKFYQLSPPEDLTLALTLVRHVGFFNDEESIKAVALTKEKYGTVPRVYIVCGKDNILKQDFQRWIVESSPPNEVKLIPDSDHMIMFSKPKELCSCLEEIAEKYT
ncbi:hypothetical protein ES319_D12G074200v1 [Gossypium barbadense]|uniref:AB hydrolase-1 domain-containing protein n=1 Tax=Gossypium barbadense TaxID=3634 RepID=A0A5J5NV30_GOSBA|nr:hypothetical protein ES319_D12G074200v1 [Gossypium barbadense]